MISRFGISFVVISVLTLGCRVAPSSDAATTDAGADVSAIRALSAEFDRALSAGETDAFLAVLADSVMWMIPNQPALTGREAVRNRVDGFFRELRLDLATTVSEVRVAGDLAYMRGTYRLGVTPMIAGSRSEETGKLINILERQTDGSWRVTRHIWNADYPES